MNLCRPCSVVPLLPPHGTDRQQSSLAGERSGAASNFMKIPYRWLIALALSCWVIVALCALHDRPLAAVLAVSLFSMAWIIVVRFKKKLPLILAAAFLAQQVQAQEQQPPEPILPYAIGVVVVIVGGVVTYKFVRFCQRKFPKDKPPDTNAPPDQVQLPDGGTAGAAWTYASQGSCYWPPTGLLPSPGPGVFEISAQLYDPDGSHPQLRAVTSRWDSGPEATEDAPEFFAELAGYGLTMNPTGNGQSWSRNNVPVPQEQCPIVLLGDEAHTVEVNACSCSYSRVVAVERSYDLQEWSPVVRTVLQSGMKLRFQDATESGSAFYRVTLQNL